VKSFKKCCILSAGECYEMLGESVRKMKALTMKMETVTVIGKVDRIRHVL